MPVSCQSVRTKYVRAPCRRACARAGAVPGRARAHAAGPGQHPHRRALPAGAPEPKPNTSLPEQPWKRTLQVSTSAGDAVAPARCRVRGPRAAAPGTRPAPDSGRARAAAGDGAPIDLVSAVDELAAQLQTEFDFRREAETMDLIHARLKARCPPTPRPNPLHTQSLLAHAPVRCQGAGVRACAGRGRGLPARREGDQAR